MGSGGICIVFAEDTPTIILVTHNEIHKIQSYIRLFIYICTPIWNSYYIYTLSKQQTQRNKYHKK